MLQAIVVVAVGGIGTQMLATRKARPCYERSGSCFDEDRTGSTAEL